MKLQIINTVIVLLLIVGCSKEDDTSTKEVLLIGTWKPIKEVDVCSTGSEFNSVYSVCEQMGRTIFSLDGTLKITQYQDLDNGGCEQYNITIGQWELIENDLILSIPGESIEPTFFELSSNTLRVGYYDYDPNDLCDGGNLPSHYYTEFERVN
jgi:hypothetical protein